MFKGAIFQVSSILAMVVLAPVHAQLITAEVSLVSGTVSSNFSKPASFPASIGLQTQGNTPGGRARHRIMCYQGLIHSFFGQPNNKNDVWTFNPVDNKWTWIAGRSDNANFNYGLQGIASSANTPGYRYSFGGDIHQSRNVYILFGGSSSGGSRSDIWTFNLAAKTWTWLAGPSTVSETSVYGTLGVSTVATTPGARTSMGCVVYEPTGEFLVYGGFDVGFKADMWSFDFSSLHWTWISGPSTSNIVGSYGVKGSWSTSTYPRARRALDLVYDSDSGLIYIFGGTVSAPMNDVWAFRRHVLEWSWVKGPSTPSVLGICGTMGFPDAGSYPGPRSSHSFVYHPTLRRFLMFGGEGYGCAGGFGLLSDFWTYNPSLNEWAWISGTSISDSGSEGASNFLEPLAQTSGSMAVDKTTGYIYKFGGLAYLSPNVLAATDHMWSIDFFGTNRMVSLSSRVSSSGPAGTSSHKLSIIHDVSPPAGLLERIWPFKLYLLTGVLLFIVFFLSCVAYKYVKKCHQKPTSSIETAQSFTDFSTKTSVAEQSITNSSQISGQDTLMSTSMGLYLPGSLQVIAAKAYRVEKEIARGGGGSVFIATAFDAMLKDYGPQVIVKVPKATEVVSDRDTALFHQEIALLNAFKHKRNIVKLLGFSQYPQSIVLKYYPRGSLLNWIKSSLSRSLRQSFAFMCDISNGVSELHTNGIAHCDLKPDNILIDDGGSTPVAVLADFGIARVVSDKLLQVFAYEVQSINGVSILYASPEAITELRQIYKGRSSPQEIMARDIYAIGIITAAILNGREAWK